MTNLYMLRSLLAKSIVLGVLCILFSGQLWAQARTITGTIYNYANGTTGNANGAAYTGTAVAVNLYAPDGTTVVASTTSSTGTGVYTFTAHNNSTTYIVAVTAPAGFAHVSSSDNITPTDGITTVAITTANITGVHFGIQPMPTAVSSTLTSQFNPMGSYNIPMPAPSFSASDVSPGRVGFITITSFLTNALSITIGGVTYTSGTFSGAGVNTASNGSGNPAAAISIDPDDGAVTSVITYAAIDNLGSPSSAATVSVPFTNPVAFSCSNLAYRVAGDASGFTTLYSYNINTNTRTIVGANTIRANATGDNTADNLIWGFDRTNVPGKAGC